MPNPICFSKCWVIGWFPLVLSLQQAHAHANPPPPAIVSHKILDHSKMPPSAIAVSGSPGSLEAAQNDSLRSGAAASMGSPLAGDRSPTSSASVSTVPTAPPEMLSQQPSSSSSQAATNANSTPPKKEPKSVAPRLERFFAGSRSGAPWPTAITPPDRPQNKPQSAEGEMPDGGLDPELGMIRVADPRTDPELGTIQLRNPLQDPELGILQLRQIVPAPGRRPVLFLSTYVTASNSDNVFLVEDPIQGRFGDNFIRPGISLIAFPSIGPQTNLLVSAETNLLRYDQQSASNYDELRFRAGIRHRFSDRVYGQLSFSSQLLFREGYADQFFSNSGVELTLNRRDVLTPQLTLDSFYQGQVYFSDPEQFSNVLNSVGTYLGYRISPRWDTGIGYRLTISDFTRQSRHETYQRITGQLRYAITPSVRLSLFGGLSYGRSTEPRITFDDTFFGISIDATIPIF
ncbi:MAG: hypothetical protein ACFB0G_13945 [Leptolyngbyaceae cyanobacterium]